MRSRKRRARRGMVLLLALAVMLLAAGIAGTALALHSWRTLPADADLSVPMALPGAAPAPTPDSEEGFAWLPVVRRGNAEKKQIAITVDDCFQVGNLRAIIDTAAGSGGRLTLFPIGQNLEKPGMAALLRHSAFDLGFEIENHTWSHARIFRLPEAEMAAEIWRQAQAVNQALGVNYRQHFFRLMGGDGERDQRTHNYLQQLGYSGIAGWSLSGSDADMDMIRAALKPGAVYLFHTTDGDTKKLQSFIPYAVAQGYQLVTLNQLLGLPDNEVSPLCGQAMPAPRAYAPDHATCKAGDYAWCVVGLQDALRRLGYLKLEGASTGYFGRQTADAVAAFQRDHGLQPTGQADARTQELLGV